MIFNKKWNLFWQGAENALLTIEGLECYPVNEESHRNLGQLCRSFVTEFEPLLDLVAAIADPISSVAGYSACGIDFMTVWKNEEPGVMYRHGGDSEAHIRNLAGFLTAPLFALVKEARSIKGPFGTFVAGPEDEPIVFFLGHSWPKELNRKRLIDDLARHSCRVLAV